ncbi:MAG: amino acid ABC transporter permease [Gammaproteobacteria bacterium]
MKYQWDFDVVWENLPLLLSGLTDTIGLAISSMLGGMVLGMLVVLARLSRWRILSMAAYAYTELFRTTPLLVQIAWVFYVMPLVTGIALSPFNSGLLALALNVAAFMAEIYRAGITSVGRGQSEAGLALGMTEGQMLRRIILPQALMRMVPPIGTIWVSLFKDTALLSAIGVTEMMFQARFLASDTYRPLEIFTVTAVVYFAITLPQSVGVNWLYRKFRVQE